MGKNGVINEVSDNTVANEEGGRTNDDSDLIPSYYMPVVLIANEKLKSSIEQICLQLARTYKKKIIDLVPELCRECEITDADQEFDSEKIVEKISEMSDQDD